MNASTQPARLRPFRPQPFGRYTLLSHLATGGMGEIYLARLEGAQGFEKLCVIKRILPQLAADAEFVERFVGEARTLVRLSHGSIAQVLDMGLHEGDAYMALEHVDGKDLRKVAARVRDKQVPLPLTFILYIMGRVLDALAYAHRKKDDDGEELRLVHRDISPQNILISYEGEVKVIDFGLAKSRLSAAKTNPSIILGKFLYMSPEQARHQPVDRRSDLYAVGLCLYELISGKNPFDSVHPGELMSVVAHPRIAPLDEVEPLTPRAVTALVSRALAVDPAQRFQTAEEFRGRLQACLMEIDPSAGPESVSRFMRELFAADFQSERRLLASLKEVPRLASGEVPPEEPGPAPRPTLQAMLPPKTIRLDGPVEALSFRPTPRSREGGGPVSDGETRPGVMVDESTRPAFPLEALEEEARARASRPPPGAESASSVEVRPEAYVRPAVAEPAPAPRPPTLTREVPMTVLPPEALPSAPEPRPTPSDLRPTELALPSVTPRSPAPAPELPWGEEPFAALAEPTDPRAEPLPTAPPPQRAAALALPTAPPPPGPRAGAVSPLPAAPPPGASQAPRAAAVPPSPAAPPRSALPPVASAIPAVGAPQAAPPPPRPQPPAAPASGAGSRVGAPAAPVPPPAVAPVGSPPRPAMGAAPVPPSAPAPTAPLASGAPPRTGAVVMPAVTPGAAPPRTASQVAVPLVASHPPGSTPARGSPSMPSAELDVVPGAAEDDDAGWDASASEAGREEGTELPVVTPEQMGHAEEEAPRPGETDTDPRIARPSRSERSEDTPPRVARGGDTNPRIVRDADTNPRATLDGDTGPRLSHRHDDTQPRVVLDEAFLRDVQGTTGEPEEKSSPGRSRAASRRPRASGVGLPAQQGAARRTGSIPALRAVPSARVGDDEDDGARVSLPPQEETRRTPIPTRPGAEAPARRAGDDARRTAAPKRSRRLGPVWLAIGLVMGLLASVLMLALSPELRVSLGLETLPEGPQPDRSLGPAMRKSPSGGAAPAKPAASPEARADTPEAASPGAAGAAPDDKAPAVAADEGAGAGPAAAGAPPAAGAEAEPAAGAGAEPAAGAMPAAGAEAAGDAEEPAKETLAKSPPAKRPPPPKKVRSSSRDSDWKGLTELQQEWQETNRLFQTLKSKHSCESLKLLCTRHADLKREVAETGDADDEETLQKVRVMKNDLEIKALELE
jgi:serine/threonine protein kinase